MKKDSYTEYKDFAEEFVLPLLSITNNNLLACYEVEEKYFVKKDNFLFFGNGENALIKVEYKKEISEDDINLVNNILQMFFRVSEFNMRTQNKKRNYFSKNHLYSNYKLAVQRGICNWITESNDTCMESLMNILEKWSVQTYEGKKVPFAFIINPDANKEILINSELFNNFLKDDFAAVFTDCIETAIELDSKGNLIDYLSLTEDKIIDSYSLSNYLPLRFSQIVQKFVTGRAIGVFLLANGDIILSKNQQIRLVKRNLKWLNLSFEGFKHSFGHDLEELKISDELLANIYASTLDVSFSHSGGIISVVKDVESITKSDSDGYPILHRCDFLLDKISFEGLTNYFKEKNDEYEKNGQSHLKVKSYDIDKRILKRRVLQVLVADKTFEQMDRKLRSELIALDGACILNSKGEICSFGAIIKNDSGSSGGGRGAAAKKLSRFGMAIKISTDGYIELYIDGNIKYAIK